ncbi:metalloregulator ArsR/SmtB family transcription factor [Cognatiyoonia sp. IB215182]|uniref:ArsR/SmtB family transcription factor n=1 Tax=Cognatiyoonia sp. IB215182 TaxID=3097353 RepID=UPI002A134321|nr:metalloregulator ArsR/SmtB family transcription factor [Cognatiyoonia sp. IB215182]MDX8350835.1 metalloregulator ArsR/SmtB family transcription factor [Cognatiyoonia sp. IB215182]
MKIKEMNSAADQVCELMTLLSNKSRLMILCLLTEGEKSVGQLAEAIDARDTAVSQQLAVLRRERIVKPRRDGQTMFYRIVDPNVAEVLEFLYAKYCGDAADGKERHDDTHDN